MAMSEKRQQSCVACLVAVVLTLLLVCCMHSLASRESPDAVSATNLISFWHIGLSAHNANCTERSLIVEEQFDFIRRSPVYRNRGLEVRVVLPDGCQTPSSCAMPLALLERIFTTPRFKRVARPRQQNCEKRFTEHYEMPTLYRLHEHCAAHPRDLVSYMHSKSDHATRRTMMEQLLGTTGDVQCLAGCFAKRSNALACGPNLAPALRMTATPSVVPAFDGNNFWAHPDLWARYGQPGQRFPMAGMFCPLYVVPWCHFSSNYWWARCEHVNRLQPPISRSAIGEPDRFVSNPLIDIRPYGRYFAEWWLLNDLKHERHDEGRHAPLAAHSNLADDGMGAHRPLLRTKHLVNGSVFDEKGRCKPLLTPEGEALLRHQPAGGQSPYNITWPALCPAAAHAPQLQAVLCNSPVRILSWQERLARAIDSLSMMVGL